MQKSGIKFWELMPKTIVPLDSAFVNLVYTAYFSAFDGFLQAIKLGVCLLDCHANWHLLAMTMQCCKATKKRKKTTPGPVGTPSTGGERIDVFNVQAQEVFRTQWAPTCVGVTTVCEIYPLKYRHTGAGRYPLFLVFHICIYKLDCHANWRLPAMTMQLREWRFCV